MINIVYEQVFIKSHVLALYRKGLLYLEVPIADDDCIIGRPFYHITKELLTHILLVSYILTIIYVDSDMF